MKLSWRHTWYPIWVDRSPLRRFICGTNIYFVRIEEIILPVCKNENHIRGKSRLNRWVGNRERRIRWREKNNRRRSIHKEMKILRTELSIIANTSKKSNKEKVETGVLVLAMDSKWALSKTPNLFPFPNNPILSVETVIPLLKTESLHSPLNLSNS